MTEPKMPRESDAARTEEGEADENSKILTEKAEEGLKNAETNCLRIRFEAVPRRPSTCPLEQAECSRRAAITPVQENPK
jgi:hypothetical protein